MTDFAKLRERMVERQIEGRGIHRPVLLAAMRSVPREMFVSPQQAGAAYGDHPLPIEAGQTISQPYIVALMIDAAEIGADDMCSRSGRVGLCRGRDGPARKAAWWRLSGTLNGDNRRRADEGARLRQCPDCRRRRQPRLARGTSFDAILPRPAEAGSASVDRPTQARGRLVMPLGGRWSHPALVKLTKRSDGRIDREELGAVRFVTLIGQKTIANKRSELA